MLGGSYPLIAINGVAGAKVVISTVAPDLGEPLAVRLPAGCWHLICIKMTAMMIESSVSASGSFFTNVWQGCLGISAAAGISSGGNCQKCGNSGKRECKEPDGTGGGSKKSGGTSSGWQRWRQ